MPAMLDDPTAPVIYRTSGPPPYPTAVEATMPQTITARQVTLRDRNTIATLMPFARAADVPPRLLGYLADSLNIEIEKGDTYPMVNTMTNVTFGTYWFQNFGAVMILGEVADIGHLAQMENEGAKWDELCLGSFYVKPNYPGRSSHICNGGFLVTQAARNKGVGRQMGEIYLEWAPKLGYSYSVFNLVYENNVASMRIWDALGFKRIGRVKGAGNLRSHPDELVDAIVYGRDLGPEAEDYVSEERFDKIRFYLKHGKYPQGADRAEKSRLRSAATHYKLLPAEDGNEEEDGERLMLKDKEVISDPKKQYEIARELHQESHGGINKTTASIAEKYHWVRIKETVSLVIKNCHECKDNNQRPEKTRTPKDAAKDRKSAPVPTQEAINQLISFSKGASNDASASPSTALASRTLRNADEQAQARGAPVAHMHAQEDYTSIPLDPQIMQTQSPSSSAAAPISSNNTHPVDLAEGMRQLAEYGTARQPPPPHPSALETDMSAPTSHAHRMSIDDPDATAAGVVARPPDDTRLATLRHVRQGDEPMAYQMANGSVHHLRERRGGDGGVSGDAMDTSEDGGGEGGLGRRR